MPEVGNMTLPKKLLQLGITDMVRISDGRMSGTGFGTVVLHVSPEAAAGGNFSVVENGDLITLDVAARTLQLKVSDEVLTSRKLAWKPSPKATERGYVSLYIDHVLQAHEGADLDFCRAALVQMLLVIRIDFLSADLFVFHSIAGCVAHLYKGAFFGKNVAAIKISG